MRVRKYTEIVLKNVLSRSEKPQGTMKFAPHTVICEEIVSYGHEGLVVHRNSPQKRAERVEKLDRKSVV